MVNDMSVVFVAGLWLLAININLEITMTWNLIVKSTMNSIGKTCVWGGLGLLGSQVISLTARKIETCYCH